MTRLRPALRLLAAAAARTALVGLILLLAALIFLTSAGPAALGAAPGPADLALDAPAALP